MSNTAEWRKAGAGSPEPVPRDVQVQDLAQPLHGTLNLLEALSKHAKSIRIGPSTARGQQ